MEIPAEESGRFSTAAEVGFLCRPIQQSFNPSVF